MADLFCLRLGESMRSNFAEQAKQFGYGEALLVLPNRFLLQDIQKLGTVRAVNMDYLPNEILRANSRDRFTMLSRRSQEILVKNLIENKKKTGELHYLLKVAESDSFAKIVTSFIGELSRAGVTTEEFAEALNAWDRNNAYGLKDEEISSIYAGYRKILKKNSWYDIDGLYRLATLELKKPESNFPWSKLFFSDFYQFDRLQLDLIDALKDRCEVSIGIVGDTKNDKLYGATLNTISDLIGCGFQSHKVTDCSKRNASLEHFSLHWKNEVTVFEDKSIDIKVLEASGAEHEMRLVLERIKKQLTQNMACEDILLVVRNLDSYSGLRKLFEEYGIPTTLPRVTSFSAQPAVELLDNLLNFGLNSFDIDIFCNLLGCNFSKLLYAFDGESLLELRTRNFFSNSAQLREHLYDNGYIQVDSGISELLEWADNLPGNATSGEYCLLLRNVIKGWSLAEKFGNYYKQDYLSLEQLKNSLLTEKTCYEVLDEIEKFYEESKEGQRKISLEEFIKIWREIGLEKKVVLEKGNSKGICVLEAPNVQGVLFKHIYVLGLREGAFPEIKQENWLYNDSERNMLKVLGVDLRTSGMALVEDQYFFASTVAAATKSVTFSYFVDDEAGVSGYLEELKRYYPEESLTSELVNPFESDYWSEQQFAQKLCRLNMLHEKERNWLVQRVGKDYEFRRDLDKTRFVIDSPYQGYLQGDIQKEARSHLSEYYNASALELYAFCPFKFLINRIWRTDVWQEVSDEIEATDQGDLYHVVLARIFTKYAQKNISVESMEIIEKDLNNIFDTVCDEFLLSGKITKTDFLEAEKQQIRSKLLRVLRMEKKYQEDLAHSHPKLLPAFLEWGFGKANPLCREIDDEKAYFVGRIDRIDSDGRNLFVTDYKRSYAPTKKDFEAGLDLQMPLYVLAAKESFENDERKVLGGGYFSVDGAVRKNGYWCDEAVMLPWVKRGEEDWYTFLEQAEDNLKKCVRGIRTGIYNTEPKGLCPKYCPGIDICRFSLANDFSEGGESND